MSIIGILSSNLFSTGAVQNTQSSQNTPSTFQQIKAEFQQLGQDLQSGNVAAAQSDFTTLSKNLSTIIQAPTATTTTAANPSASPLATAFAKLGQDLQSGNLQAAQQDFATVQQDAQQLSANQQVAGHGHHHHHTESSQSSSSSSQQTNPVNQAFSALAQDLQTGNLSGAQSAFSALQNDLQQIGGFLAAGSNGTSTTAVPSSTASLNVSA
jgi:outer membrane protein assembly factor BamD (BamD/ComL family)